MTHHHIIRDLAYFLLSIGGLGLGIAYLSSHGFLSGIMHEYPLNPTSMVMDHDKNIYVASEFYGIVQVYTSHGRFKTSFYVPNANGNPFRIRLGSNNVVQVNVENDAKTYCFNTNGEIIKTLPQKISAYEQFTNQQQIITHHTTKYYISPSIFYPKIIKEENNIKHVLIETPRHLMLLQAPFPAWVIWTLGIAFLALSKGDLQKKVFQRRFSCVQIKQTKTQTRIVISQKMKDHMGEISLLILCSILWAYGGYKLSNPIFFKDFSLTRTILYLLLGIIWVLGLRHILLTILWLSCGKEIIFISARKFEIQKEIFLSLKKTYFLQTIYL